MASYETALVCLNGHLVCYGLERSPIDNKNYCDKCGSATISHCQSCKGPLHGDYHTDFGSIISARVTSFCYACGQPYPWTKAKIDSLREAIEQDETTNNEQKLLAIETIPDLIVDTAKTQVSAMRMRRFILDSGKTTQAIIKKMLEHVASEKAKEILFL